MKLVHKLVVCILSVTVVSSIPASQLRHDIEEIEDVLKQAIEERDLPEPEEEPHHAWKKQEFVVRQLINEEPDDAVIGHEEDIREINEEKRYVQNTSYPTTYGVSPNSFAGLHPGGVRPGQASLDFNCKSISSVPPDVQSMYGSTQYGGPGGVPASFYKKYLHAYGIPIIGSEAVKKKAMKRACYTVATMLAGRYDIANAIYKNWGRYAVLAITENHNDLPDYLNYVGNSNSRGMGPTTNTPVSSSGEENMLCQSNDVYPSQDIVIHETAHLVDRLGASHIVPGFARRLGDIYSWNQEKGKWKNTYADENANEFFAIASMFYWNAWRNPQTSYLNISVVDRETMRTYDPNITQLLDEIYPCTDTVNDFVQRCPDCYKGAVLAHDASENLYSNCPITASRTAVNVGHCLRWACMYKKTAVQFYGTTCQVLNCPISGSIVDLQLGQPDESQKKHIYSLGNMVYTSTLSSAISHLDNTIKKFCTNGPDGTATCNNAPSSGEVCGPIGTGADDCRKIGCCFDSGSSTCYHAQQTCSPALWYCYYYAMVGYCDNNAYNIPNDCKLHCGLCNF